MLAGFRNQSKTAGRPKGPAGGFFVVIGHLSLIEFSTANDK
jgi:hypothetical protein